jgi:tRNA threonylcarbamoyladenosine biosynthesis protein TsaB
MITLGIDTAGPATSVALWDDVAARVLAANTTPMQRGHAEAVMPIVEAVVREGLGTEPGAIRRIDRISVLSGPGSFTGVRIGVAAARGLALALDVPAVGVTAFEAVAALHLKAGPTVPFAVAFDAKRGQLYLQCFDVDGAPLGMPSVVAVDDAATGIAADIGLVLGSGAGLLAGAADRLGRTLDVAPAPSRDAVVVARLGASRKPGAAPLPLYLRAPDARPQGPALMRAGA